jgi:hypothetical protein
MSYNSSAGTPRALREDGDMNSDIHSDIHSDIKDSDHALRRAHLRLAACRRGATLAAAVVGLVLLTAACSNAPSNPGVASLSGATTTTTDPVSGSGVGLKPTAAQSAELLAYSHCMQTHGVPDFPDPNANGSLQISGGPGSDLNPNSAQFKKAQSECQKLMPVATPAQQAQALASGLKLAECMRAHGITDFPDPNSKGQMQIKISPGSELNPNNPQFQAAQKACGGHLPAAPKGGKESTGSGGQSSGGVIGVGP